MNFSKIKINLPAIAFVMAVGAAFAFNERIATPVWYPLQSNGDIIDDPQFSPLEECSPGDVYCAVEFDNDEIDGELPMDNVEESDPNDYIKDVLFKE